MSTEAKNPQSKDEAPPRPVRLVAVGDLLMPAGYAADAADASAGPLAGMADVLSAGDVVLGNLECTLPGANGTVETEPRVLSEPRLVRMVAAAGFHVVSLANNHMFDCLADGFHRLRALLDELGVAHFGAGDDLDEAAAPAIVKAGGLRLAFLGAADERSNTRPMAGPGQWGVAPLDVDRLTGQIRELGGQVDHVIVSPHWGEERFSIPSPEQIDQARRLIDAGASMVIGHHPHVIQGMELRQGRPIAYSLGNFAAGRVPYVSGDRITWNRTERTGCVLTALLSRDGVSQVRQLATHDDGGRIAPDDSGFGARRIARVNAALRRPVTLARYRREHRRVKTYRAILDHLRWSQLKRLRWRQVRKALALFRGSRQAK